MKTSFPGRNPEAWSVRRAAFGAALFLAALVCPDIRADADTVARGAVLLPPSDYQALRARPRYRAFLPPSADLSRWFPTAGTQGRQPSCTAWATAYELRSYFENRRSSGQSVPVTPMSPAYVYNKLAQPLGACTAGLTVPTALELMRREGVPPLREFAYNENSCDRLPDVTIDNDASRFRITEWSRLNKNHLDDLKGEIAQGYPVVVIMLLADSFEHFQGSGIYDDAEISPAGHAMVAVAYDDMRQAFKVANSWGTHWGRNGFGWISYRTFAATLAEAYTARIAEPMGPAPLVASEAQPSDTQPLLTPPPLATPPQSDKHRISDDDESPRPHVTQPIQTTPSHTTPPVLPPQPPRPKLVLDQPKPLQSQPGPTSLTSPPSPAPSPSPVPVPAPVQVRPAPPQSLTQSTPVHTKPLDQLPQPFMQSLQNLNESLRCAQLDGERQKDGRLLASGFVSSVEDQKKAESVLRDHAGKEPLTIALKIKAWPQCEVLETFAQPLAVPRSLALHLGGSSGGSSDQILKNGAPLTLQIVTPDFPSYLYVSYVQADGQVVELHRLADQDGKPLPPNSPVTLGGPQKFRISGPPFGEEIVLAVASRLPLFALDRPAEETEREFLTQFRLALYEQNKRGQADIAARLISLKTTP